MGNCGENTAKNLGITREEQDAYGIESYRRSAAAYANNVIQPEIFEVSVPQKKGKAPPLIVAEDEEYKKINFDKFSKLPTVFQRSSWGSSWTLVTISGCAIDMANASRGT